MCKIVPHRLSLALLVLSGNVLRAESPAEKHSFAIYLVEDAEASYAALRDEAWRDAKLAETPILSDADIVSYDIRQHAMTLTPEGMARVMKRSLGSTLFVVIADGQRVYAGYFTSRVVSAAFPAPAITVDRPTIFPGDPANTLFIDRAYPNGSFAAGADPRSDPRVVAALKALGKLVAEGPKVDEALTQKIGQILLDCQTIKPGTTRAELLRVFTTEGGLSTPGQRTHVHRRCPYIKIDVEFTLSEPDQRDEQPTDTVRKVSRAYLNWSIMD